jgi:hypothetical protein
LPVFSVRRSKDAWFEFLGAGDSRTGLLDDCRPGEMAAAIYALTTDRCFDVFFIRKVVAK